MNKGNHQRRIMQTHRAVPRRGPLQRAARTAHTQTGDPMPVLAPRRDYHLDTTCPALPVWVPQKPKE